ncbi:MAG: HEAT repeat domain-containing protein, partial [Planctomycetota bacterium]|jgi:HEAT repeat protein
MRRRDEALPWLLELAGDPEAEVRAAALRAIRFYRAPTVNQALKTALGDPEAEVRAAALESLRTTASPDLAPRIRPFLKDPDPAVRTNAAQLLGRFGDRSALPTLLELLGQRDRDFLTRTMYAVLDALGKIGDPVAIEPLWKLLEDADRYPTIRNIRYRILSTIVTVGGVEIISKIRPYLADPTIQNRSYILDALSKLETEETIPILLDALKKGDARLRTSAVRGLARRDQRESAPLILKALGEETDTWFLTEAVRALTAFEHREALPAMLGLLDGDPADSSRTGLFYALLRAVDRFRVRKAAPRVAEIAAASRSYRYIGTDILGRLGNPAAVPTFQKLFEAEEDAVLRHRMARALARMGARDPLTAMCREQGPESDWSVEDLIALGRYDTAKAKVTALLEKSPDHPARLYDLGCLLALTGEKDRAFEVLGRAFERPPVSRQHMLTDPDLDPLRDDPRFADLLEKAR